jgi:hypothetical protein
MKREILFPIISVKDTTKKTNMPIPVNLKPHPTLVYTPMDIPLPTLKKNMMTPKDATMNKMKCAQLDLYLKIDKEVEIANNRPAKLVPGLMNQYRSTNTSSLYIDP